MEPDLSDLMNSRRENNLNKLGTFLPEKSLYVRRFRKSKKECPLTQIGDIPSRKKLISKGIRLSKKVCPLTLDGGDFRCAGSIYSIPPSGMENSRWE